MHPSFPSPVTHRSHSVELLVLLFMALVMGDVVDVRVPAILVVYLIVIGVVLEWHRSEWRQFVTALVLAMVMWMVSLTFLGTS